MNDTTLDLTASPATLFPFPASFVSQGAGKAYQSVAQSMAIAVQDATDGMRNSTTMANTAMGVALAQFLATKDEQYLKAMPPAQAMVAAAAASLATIGTTATTILKEFPSSTS